MPSEKALLVRVPAKRWRLGQDVRRRQVIMEDWSGRQRRTRRTHVGPRWRREDGQRKRRMWLGVLWNWRRRARRPVVSSQHTDRFIIENDETNSYAEAESELSLGSRSFLHKVNDQVRKGKNNPQKMRHKTATNILRYGDCLCLQHCKHLYLW